MTPVVNYTIYEYTGRYNQNRTYYANARRGYIFHYIAGTKADAIAKAEELIAEGKNVRKVVTNLGTVVRYF
jgi:hypothetical protein